MSCLLEQMYQETLTCLALRYPEFPTKIHHLYISDNIANFHPTCDGLVILISTMKTDIS